MSQENVEIVQQALGHFQQTGEPLWDTVDPNVEVHDHDIPFSQPSSSSSRNLRTTESPR
jgi:hypothetical protein